MLDKTYVVIVRRMRGKARSRRLNPVWNGSITVSVDLATFNQDIARIEDREGGKDGEGMWKIEEREESGGPLGGAGGRGLD